MVNLGTEQAGRVLTLAVDLWYRLCGLPGIPAALFQFPRVFFPEGDNPTGKLVCSAMGTRRYDDCMLVYDLHEIKGTQCQ